MHYNIENKNISHSQNTEYCFPLVKLEKIHDSQAVRM